MLLLRVPGHVLAILVEALPIVLSVLAGFTLLMEDTTPVNKHMSSTTEDQRNVDHAKDKEGNATDQNHSNLQDEIEQTNVSETPLQYIGDVADDSSHNSEDEWEDIENSDAESPDEIFMRLAAAERIATRSVDEENLPSTVTVLNGNFGEKVYLIGTAHFSTESCEDVRKVIREAKPDVVVIELCRGRTDIVHNDEKRLLELAGEVNSTKILRQIREKGVVSGLMTFFLLHMSAHITKQLGMAPGSEFRTAHNEAQRIPGCKVMFGDRPVSVTLQRAFAELPIWQKVKFAFHALRDLGPIKPEDIEKLKKKDFLEQALGEMMVQFPQLTKVFLAERDVYLARSLQLASGMAVHINDRVLPPVVVGVVGLGHAAGVAEHYKRVIDFDEVEKLMEVPKPSKYNKIIRNCTKLLFLALCMYGLYQTGLKATSLASYISGKVWSGIHHMINVVDSSKDSIATQEL